MKNVTIAPKELATNFYCQSCCQLSMFDDSDLLVESGCLCQEKQKKKKSKKLETKKLNFNYI